MHYFGTIQGSLFKYKKGWSSYLTLRKKEFIFFRENIVLKSRTQKTEWNKYNCNDFLVHNDIPMGYSIPSPHEYVSGKRKASSSPFILSLVRLGIYLEQMKYGKKENELFKISDSSFRYILSSYACISHAHRFNTNKTLFCSKDLGVITDCGDGLYKLHDNNKHIYDYFRERHGRVAVKAKSKTLEGSKKEKSPVLATVNIQGLGLYKLIKVGGINERA